MITQRSVRRDSTPQVSESESRAKALTVTGSGTVIVEVSSAVKLLKDNGTLDAIKKYMQPRYARR